MIERNTTIPTRKAETYTTAADGQTSVEIHVLQGEREMASDNKTLGKFHLMNIPSAPRGIPQIEVTFDIDANGILDVKAKDRATSREQQVRITASSMLSKTDVDRMVNEAAAHADEDKKRKEEVETRNQADALAYQAERTLRDLGDKVSPEDKAETERRIEAVRTALKGDDLAAIKSAFDALVEQLQKVSTAAYQASAAAGPETGGPSGGDDDQSGPTDGSPDQGGEEVVEGEFKEA
jgi:molecular chaperone DnaK